jgi:hypothetical protein
MVTIKLVYLKGVVPQITPISYKSANRSNFSLMTLVSYDLVADLHNFFQDKSVPVPQTECVLSSKAARTVT